MTSIVSTKTTKPYDESYESALEIAQTASFQELSEGYTHRYHKLTGGGWRSLGGMRTGDELEEYVDMSRPRPCFYTWKRRHDAEGLDGLRDRSSKPHFSPLATHTDVVDKIVYLRQHYHFGPSKISMYLARYHEI